MCTVTAIRPWYADVIAAIREDRAPYVDGRAGMRALELVLAIYLSAAAHQPVRRPLRTAPRRILRGDSADERIHPPHRCGG